MKIATTKERILQFIDYKGIKQPEFLSITGIKRGFLDGDKLNSTVSDIFIAKIIASFPEINTEWLITGKGEMLKKYDVNYELNYDVLTQNKEKKPTYNTDNTLTEVAEPLMTVRRLKTDYFDLDKQAIPLYEIEAAAGLNTLFSNQSTQVPLDYIVVPNAPKCDGALYIRGDSMYPVLKSGDIACYKIIKEFDDIRYGEIHILDIEDSSDRYLTAKYIQKSDNGSEFLKLVSENKYHSDRDIHKSTIKAIGLVKIWIRYNTIS